MSVPSSVGLARRPPETVRGTGLHSGKSCSVTLSAGDGDVAFRTPAGRAGLGELAVLRTDQGVAVRCPRIGFAADSIEHLFAALGGLGIRSGVVVDVEGGEVPLGDGTALLFCECLERLEARPSAPRLSVDRDAEIRVGESRYFFAPSEETSIDVRIEFLGFAIGVEEARWDGDPASFVRDVAWARTFGFARDRERLHAAGRALGADPRAVMVLDDGGRVQPPGAAPRPGEFARHKLLDLVGDLYAFGGPPRGRIRAVRPGHGATHRAMAEALETGVVVPENARRP